MAGVVGKFDRAGLVAAIAGALGQRETQAKGAAA